jgi:hypothetical protein
MRIEWSLVCREIAPDPDNARLATLRGAGADIWEVKRLPQRLSIPLAVCAAGSADEVGREHPQVARTFVRSPYGELLAESEAEAWSEIDPVRTDSLNRWVHTETVTFRAQAEGRYTIGFEIGDAGTTVTILVVS